MSQIPEVIDFLACATPVQWLEEAARQPELLLIDHAHCEKKAASTAMNLLFRYVDRPELLEKQSQLAREELLHFEQVLGMMQQRGIHYQHLTPSRYAGELRQMEYESLVKTAAAVHATGLCTANLIYSPCEHLNDFESQCALCPSSCHVNRDQEAIELLEKDLAVQNRRLNEVQRHPNFHISEAMQKWFMIHHRNTSILGELVGLMKSTDIKEGSLIRLLTDVNEIRITDLQNRTIEKRTLALPNAEEILAKALADKTTEPSESNPLNDVLEALGWD